MRLNVYKVELMVMDFDNIGRDEVIELLENTRYPNRCISPTVAHVEQRVVDNWTDNHPLNNTSSHISEFHKLFD